MHSLFNCLEEEAAAIAAAARRLDTQQVELALQHLEDCRKRRAKVVITGVGKSGIVARKIAATFSSIGLTAVFLNPVDALHGDLGIVHAEDVAILLSNSGETEELLAILPHLTRRGTVRIALVGCVGSSLARGSDVVLDGSVDREICPLNLAPTASTAVAMAIGDALASVWTERAGIKAEDFAINHPAGSLGRRLTIAVADLMVPVSELTPLRPDAHLLEVISCLTKGSQGRGSLGAALVHVADDTTRLAGLITDGDLRRTLQCHAPETWDRVTACQMATVDPITVTPSALAVVALELMEGNPSKAISVLPVMEPGHSRRIAGLLRIHDLVKAGLT